MRFLSVLIAISFLLIGATCISDFVVTNANGCWTTCDKWILTKGTGRCHLCDGPEGQPGFCCRGDGYNSGCSAELRGEVVKAERPTTGHQCIYNKKDTKPAATQAPTTTTLEASSSDFVVSNANGCVITCDKWILTKGTGRCHLCDGPEGQPGFCCRGDGYKSGCSAELRGEVIKAKRPTTGHQCIYNKKDIPTTTTSTTTATTSATLPVCVEFDRVDHLEVASCESIVVKDETRACNNMFDNSISQKVKEGSCFVSQSSKRGWVEVSLAKTSNVAQVTLLAKSTGTELPGAVVQVCQDDSLKCKTLNKIGAFDKRFCTNVRGPVLRGNLIRVSIKGSALAICEMRVYSS